MPGVQDSAAAPADVPPERRRTRRTAGTDDVQIEIPGLDGREDELPPRELVTPVPPRSADEGSRELDEMGVKLMDALRTFRVDGTLVNRTTGPVVTQYEIEPSSGVKVRQFANLANDLALAMRAQSIRIVAPIPGRGAVGVEVPNPDGRGGGIPQAHRLRGVQVGARVAADRVRRGPRGAAGGGRPGAHAAPADRGRDRLGQVGLREHDHHEPGVPAHAGDAALPDGRPEDGRAVGVQPAAAPALQGGHRQPGRGRRCSSGR